MNKFNPTSCYQSSICAAPSQNLESKLKFVGKVTSVPSSALNFLNFCPKAQKYSLIKLNGEFKNLE